MFMLLLFYALKLRVKSHKILFYGLTYYSFEGNVPVVVVVDACVFYGLTYCSTPLVGDVHVVVVIFVDALNLNHRILVLVTYYSPTTTSIFLSQSSLLPPALAPAPPEGDHPLHPVHDVGGGGGLDSRSRSFPSRLLMQHPR